MSHSNGSESTPTDEIALLRRRVAELEALQTERRQAKTALGPDSQFLWSGLDHAGITLFRQDISLRYTWVYNPGTGFPGHHCVGKSDADLLPPDDAQCLTEIKQRALVTGAEVREIVRVTLDGEPFHYDLRLAPVRDEAGRLIGIQGASVEASPRARLDSSRQETSQRLKHVVENSADVIYELDLSTQSYSYANPAASRVLGYSVDELHSMTLARAQDMVHPDDRARFRALHRGMLASHEDAPKRSLDIRWRVNDGSYRWFHIDRTLLRDAQGRPLSVVGTMRDITEQREAQERAAKENSRLDIERRRLRAVLDILPVGVYIADASGRILEANPAVAAIVGSQVPLSESPEQYADDYVAWWPDTGRRVESHEWGMARAITHGEICIAEEVEMQTFGGRRKTILNYAVPILDAEGDIIGGVAVNVDITRRKEVEQELKTLNEHLEQRVAERTAVAEQRMAWLRWLANELAQAEERERRRLAHLLHDHLQQLLVGARMQLAVARSLPAVEATEALRQADELLEESLKAARSLTVELVPPILYEAGLPQALHWLACWVQEQYGLCVHVETADLAGRNDENVRTLLFQSVRELLHNVVKHAGVDEANVSLRLVDDAALEVAVEDHGVGFDPDQPRSDLLGESFGLFSIKERLELLGGHMTLQSACGQGTRVVLRAPLSLPDELEADVLQAADLGPEVDAPEAALPEEAANSGHIRVLLVDDHPIVRQGLAGLLRNEPGLLLVGEASNGLEAVDLARQLMPDVVVMDVSMPVMDGIEATHIITNELSGMCVIGLSMYGSDDLGGRMLSAGAVAHLAKGGDSSALVAAIRAHGAPAARQR